MARTSWLTAIAVAALLLTGCASPSASAPESRAPEASHTMPDGTVMTGAEHGAHGSGHEAAAEPSAAAAMICEGQVTGAIASMLRLPGDAPSTSTWNEPTFTCTYDVDGAPLMLSVHDATDLEVGAAHFDELQGSVEGARDIEGLLALGMPSFTTDAGTVAFLRDGKTLVVDATRLPAELADGTMTRDEVAYAVASAVLVCWTEHD
ncbi:MAG: hypothetical protein ACQEWM_00775 [Actinomycetota bacterium]